MKVNNDEQYQEAIDQGMILLEVNEDGTQIFGHPSAPAPIPTEIWIVKVNEAAIYIQGSPLTDHQRSVALSVNDAVRQAVRRLFGELAEDSFYLRDIDPKHWCGSEEKRKALATFISSRKQPQSPTDH